MANSFDASEVFSLAATIGTNAPKVKRLAGVVVRKTAQDIAADAKAIAPVDTGNLKGSIGISAVNDLTQEVGPTAEYGIYLELGTSRMPAQPFMGPATDRRTPGFVQAMELIGQGLVDG